DVPEKDLRTDISYPTFVAAVSRTPMYLANFLETRTIGHGFKLMGPPTNVVNAEYRWESHSRKQSSHTFTVQARSNRFIVAYEHM
ncbi:hypothetical protein Trydic_g13304, partial [Trypoxylus dichotomus]